MASLRDDERQLLRLLLTQKICPKAELEKVLGRLKTRRRSGEPVTLQDMLVRKGLLTTSEVNKLMRAHSDDSAAGGRRRSSRRRGQSGRQSRPRSGQSARHSRRSGTAAQAWKAYDPNDSQSMVESLGKREKTNRKRAAKSVDVNLPLPKQSQRRPVVGGFQLEESLSPAASLELQRRERGQSARRSAAQSKRVRKGSARHKIVVNDRRSARVKRQSAEVEPRRSSVEISHDAETMSLDTDKAAAAASRYVTLRQEEEKRKNSKRNALIVYSMTAVVIFTLIGIAAFAIKNSGGAGKPIVPAIDEQPVVTVHNLQAEMLVLDEQLLRLARVQSYAEMQSLIEKFLDRNEGQLSEAEKRRFAGKIETLKDQDRLVREFSRQLIEIGSMRGQGEFKSAYQQLSDFQQRFIKFKDMTSKKLSHS